MSSSFCSSFKSKEIVEVEVGTEAESGRSASCLTRFISGFALHPDPAQTSKRFGDISPQTIQTKTKKREIHRVKERAMGRSSSTARADAFAGSERGRRGRPASLGMTAVLVGQGLHLMTVNAWAVKPCQRAGENVEALLALHGSVLAGLGLSRQRERPWDPRWLR